MYYAGGSCSDLICKKSKSSGSCTQQRKQSKKIKDWKNKAINVKIEKAKPINKRNNNEKLKEKEKTIGKKGETIE